MYQSEVIALLVHYIAFVFKSSIFLEVLEVEMLIIDVHMKLC